ncbi:tyrosine-type recombinase/integrase [Halomicrobium urmianum]|uniref:tyrosine-type recombinase/integrase n=1 Tax=Halomicrobium urmianum TaxID=1586233 RepID=UPI001CD9A16A|nr:site-specific integrase [Halomicrobium urmianum]
MTAEQNERCAIEIEPSRTIKLAPKANTEYLNEQQLADYREYRYEFINWIRREGKNPEAYEGYSDYTAYETAYRTARYDAWVWDREDRYTTPPAPAHATAYVENNVAYRDVANSTKGKVEEALARYHDWIHRTHHVDEWDHEQIFNSSGGDAPRDFLTRRERRRVREAALETGDWREASIILACLDAALRPVEVRRARPEWVDVDNELLRIPREESSKNEQDWRTSITTRSANALGEWLDVRADDDRYDDTDALWLTRVGTRYSSRSLSRLVKRMCSAAGIDSAGRSLTLYSLRHSTGTYLTAERDLAATKAQLRHKSSKTTLKYDQVPPDQRRDALYRM